MAITPSDFSKIWASNADTPEYTFNEADYLKGWDFVGNLPPTRAMWNAMQKSTDEKMKYVFDNFGAPLTASTVAEMTMQNRVYVYTGNETGYTAGHWYYWNGSAWTDGGVYNSNTVQVDPTLTISGAAADAKVTGDVRNATNVVVDITDYTWQLGTTNSSGAIVSANNRIINTEMIPVTAGTLVSVSGNTDCMNVVRYDENQNFLGELSAWSSQSIVPNDGTAYIRVVIRKASYNPVIDATEISEQSQRCAITLKFNRSTVLLRYGNEDIKSANDNIDSLAHMRGDNLLSNAVWSIGGINVIGEEYSTYTRIRTNAVDISAYKSVRISVESGFKFICNFYDENNTFLISSNYVFDSWYKEIPENAKFIRITLGIHPDSNTATLSWATKLMTEGCAELLSTVISDNLKLTDAKLFGDAIWERGGLAGAGQEIDSTTRIRTGDFLDVTDNKAILVNFDSGYKSSIYQYDTNYNCIGTTNWLYRSSIINISPNADFIRIVFSAEPDAWLGDTSISGYLTIYDAAKYAKMTDELNGNLLIRNWFCATSVNKCEIPPLETGTTILALGDSITAETSSAGWVYHFQQMTGCTIIDRAIGGTSFGESATSDSGHWMSTQISNVTSAQWSSADMVIVAAGTNDYGHGTPLTELKTKVQSAITAIKAQTNVPIVFITPIRRGNYLTDDPMLKLPVIAGIIANVALSNQCNVVCGFDFPIPTYTTGLVDNMTRDGLHPIATGANVYARTLISALK